jgi:hypothetical protein
MLTQNELSDLFEYRDGRLYSRVFRGKITPGTCIGNRRKDGYFHAEINKRKYLLHRLIFTLKHGYTPVFIDHINGDRSDNRIENLRLATVSENMYNTKINTKNTSGFKGVHFNKQKQKWQAKLWVRGEQIARVFQSKELAVEFMELFREMAHGQFANHGHHKGASA